MNSIEKVCRQICKQRGMDTDMWVLFTDRVRDYIEISHAFSTVMLEVVEPRRDDGGLS